MAGSGEVLSLQRDNAHLRSRIEVLSRKAASPREKGLGRDSGEGSSEGLGGGSASGGVSAVAAGGGGGGVEGAEDGKSSGLPPSSSSSSSSSLLSSGSAELSPLSIGVDSESAGDAEVVSPRRSFLPFSGSGGRRGRVVVEEAVLSSPPRLVDVVDVVATNDQSSVGDQSGDSDQSADNDQSVDGDNGGNDSSGDRADGKLSKSEEGGNSAVVGRAGFASEDEAKRAFDEAGVARVVAMLRDENARPRKKLRAAEYAVEAAEAEAEGEQTLALYKHAVHTRGFVETLKSGRPTVHPVYIWGYQKRTRVLKTFF